METDNTGSMTDYTVGDGHLFPFPAQRPQHWPHSMFTTVSNWSQQVISRPQFPVFTWLLYMWTAVYRAEYQLRLTNNHIKKYINNIKSDKKTSYKVLIGKKKKKSRIHSLYIFNIVHKCIPIICRGVTAEPSALYSSGEYTRYRIQFLPFLQSSMEPWRSNYNVSRLLYGTTWKT